MNLTPLPRLSAKLQELTGSRGPGYRKTYQLVLDGKLPVETRNGRHHVRDADLPEVAAMFGLTISASLPVEP